MTIYNIQYWVSLKYFTKLTLYSFIVFKKKVEMYVINILHAKSRKTEDLPNNTLKIITLLLFYKLSDNILQCKQLEIISIQHKLQRAMNIENVEKNSGVVLSNMIATSHMWLFKGKFINIKKNLKFSSSTVLATFQECNSYVATILDNADTDHFHISESSIG